MEWVTLTLSIVGTVTGVGSLVWQVLTWRRSGHRVTVSARAGIMLHDVYANESWGPFVQIVASNVGSSPVNVTGWGILFGDGMGAMQLAAGEFPPEVALPHRLEAGASVIFHMREEKLAKSLPGRNLARARAVVSLATGQRVRSRRGIARNA